MTKRFVLWLVGIWCSLGVFAQENLNLPVRQYVLLDYHTGTVLASQEATQAVSPASITKLMTAYLVFEALARGEMKLEDEFTVSANARAQVGSRMFVEQGSRVKVADLLQGLIVQSGNDASVVLAEGLAGSEEAFVARMNAKAKALGLAQTSFANTTGLTADNHHMSANDIAKLAYALILHFPQYYHYYGQKSFTYNKIEQQNRNALLFRNPLVDGLKTGYTEAAGYCLASSEVRDGKRLIAVVLGAVKESDRYESAQQLLNYGFAQYEDRVILAAGQTVGTIAVYKGERDEVSVVPAQEVKMKLLKTQKIGAVLHSELLIAPIRAGQKVGTIEIKEGDKVVHQLDAVAAHDVEEAGFFKRQWHTMKLWFL